MTTSTRTSRRPLLTAAAAAALTAGILAPAGAATAATTPTAAVHPTSVPASAPHAAVAATSRPVAPALARVLAGYRAQIAAHGLPSPASTPRTYVRPIGNGISTDLPTRISIGNDVLIVPFTITSTTRYANPEAAVELVDARGNLIASVFVYGTPGQTSFHAEFAVPTLAIINLGEAAWITAVGSSTDETSGTGAMLTTTIKTQSLLAERVTRSGNTVSVFGAAKEFVGDTAAAAPIFAPYSDHTVYVQRWTRNGWATLQGLHTDSLGHISTRLDIPFTAGIRLYSPDTAFTFGAVTPQTVA